MALYIKQDFNIKELEKFGFKPIYDENTGELEEMYRINRYYVGEKEKRRKTTTITKDENRFGNNDFKNFWNIFKRHRVIKPFTYHLNLDVEDYEILYDLIKADIVIKE